MYFSKRNFRLSVFVLAVSLWIGLSPVHAQELYLDGEKAMKNMDELKLVQFTVSFMTSEYKSASTQSRTNFNGAKSALRVVTTGLTQELMQKIADDAYADFKAKAEANGFTLSDFDVKENLPKYLVETFPKTGNFMENCDHYQVYGDISSITVSANGEPCLCNLNLGLSGYAAKESGTQPISVSYLLGSGYLAANAKVTKNTFMNEVYNKTNVTFYPGLQVWWRSGIDIWQTKSKKGEIKINEHIYREGPAGELVMEDKTELMTYSRASMNLKVDPNKYYTDAMAVLQEANDKLIAAMVKAR
ncbi:hypothetical protein [uncultured Algoriphagus sp.]|uniref:hypothetical protein n=1 Tax=uncultured Algoriphagus sp. TaxID=417365 RepID=UPI00258A2205|nr:hypothetical protein [uncultured Algoriphagus sp.]